MSTATLKPPTGFIPPELTNSSPETIVAWLNEQVALNSSLPRDLRRRRLYPFWRVCPTCSKPFGVTDNDGVYKKKTCGGSCARKALAVPRPQKQNRRGEDRSCLRCGKVRYVPAAWLRKGGGNYCSRSCRAKANAAHLIPFAANGLGKKRPGKGMVGAKNPAWKGGVTYMRKHGNYKPIKYVRCPPEFLPMARKDGYVMEHRLLVAQALGRCLLRTEVVHHDNHDPQDNSLSNLLLFASNQDHKLYEHHGSPKPLWPT